MTEHCCKYKRPPSDRELANAAEAFIRANNELERAYNDHYTARKDLNKAQRATEVSKARLTRMLNGG